LALEDGVRNSPPLLWEMAKCFANWRQLHRPRTDNEKAEKERLRGQQGRGRARGRAQGQGRGRPGLGGEGGSSRSANIGNSGETPLLINANTFESEIEPSQSTYEVNTYPLWPGRAG